MMSPCRPVPSGQRPLTAAWRISRARHQRWPGSTVLRNAAPLRHRVLALNQTDVADSRYSTSLPWRRTRGSIW
jgi:hypothetical protein